jgi:hypothetical protein
VKFDRSSNGYGNFVIENTSQSLKTIQKQVKQFYAQFPSQPLKFLVERFINFVEVPSIELKIDDSGVEILYICNQKCVNQAYVGMFAPPKNLPEKIIQKIKEVGLHFGHFAHKIGFRGVCDIDCAVDENDTLYVSESNFRRTAGTFIDTLVRELISQNYHQSHVWLQDVRVFNKKMNFSNVLTILQQKGLLFNKSKKEGILLYADTLAYDNKCRYLIIADILERADLFETQLHHLLDSTTLNSKLSLVA